jgi:hypothetical protein
LKSKDYRCEPPHLALFLFFLIYKIHPQAEVIKMAGGVAQAAECLLSKREAGFKLQDCQKKKKSIFF